MFRCAALSTDTHLARLAADVAALADDGHASLRRADLVSGAAVAVTFALSRAATLWCARPPFAAAGVAALVLRWATHLVNAAGIVSATEGTTD
jgi:hypothetical protein